MSSAEEAADGKGIVTILNLNCVYMLINYLSWLLSKSRIVANINRIHL